MSLFVVSSRFKGRVFRYPIAKLVVSALMLSFLAPPQSAMAASEWMDILKPLVREVIVPGAQMGMRKIIKKKNAEVPQAPTTVGESEVIIMSPDSASASVPTIEEPVSSSVEVIEIPAYVEDLPPPPVATP